MEGKDAMGAATWGRRDELKEIKWNEMREDEPRSTVEEQLVSGIKGSRS